MKTSIANSENILLTLNGSISYMCGSDKIETLINQQYVLESEIKQN